MVVRTLAETEKHEKIIRMVLNHFKDQGYTNLKADLENETLPDQIGDYVPDLTCYKNDEKKTPSLKLKLVAQYRTSILKANGKLSTGSPEK
jgi:hypothetical protein